MRCRWTVRRTMQPDPYGRVRWDRAYQEVLTWTEGPADEPAGVSPDPGAREDGHESGASCPGIDAASGAGQTVEQQVERLAGHARQQGWDVPPDQIVRDDGYSGASLRRPGLGRLRDRAAARSLDLILITAPDRLARNYVHQVLLLEELQGHGCEVRFLDRPMSQDPHDQLLLQIRGAVAEYERTLITERMRRGRQRKLEAGLMLPWTRPPFGYRVYPDRPRDPAGVR